MTKKQKILTALTGGFLLLLILGRKPIKKIYTNLSNDEYIDNLNPRYKELFRRFIKAIEAKGFAVQINSGYRTFKRQSELYKEDPRNAKSGYSKHNYGLALDLQVSKGGYSYGKNTPAGAWIKTGIPALAESLGLFWGANFKNYSDAVHFEVKNIDTSKLLAQAYKQFKTTNPDLIKGNEVKIV